MGWRLQPHPHILSPPSGSGAFQATFLCSWRDWLGTFPRGFPAWAHMAPARMALAEPGLSCSAQETAGEHPGPTVNHREGTD